MSKPKKSIIEVQGAAITVLSQTDEDFISLTDIARFKDRERTDYHHPELDAESEHHRVPRFLGAVETIPVLIPSNSMGLENRRD